MLAKRLLQRALKPGFRVVADLTHAPQPIYRGEYFRVYKLRDIDMMWADCSDSKPTRVLFNPRVRLRYLGDGQPEFVPVSHERWADLIEPYCAKRPVVRPWRGKEAIVGEPGQIAYTRPDEFGMTALYLGEMVVDDFGTKVQRPKLVCYAGPKTSEKSVFYGGVFVNSWCNISLLNHSNFPEGICNFTKSPTKFSLIAEDAEDDCYRMIEDPTDSSGYLHQYSSLIGPTPRIDWPHIPSIADAMCGNWTGARARICFATAKMYMLAANANPIATCQLADRTVFLVSEDVDVCGTDWETAVRGQDGLPSEPLLYVPDNAAMDI